MSGVFGVLVNEVKVNAVAAGARFLALWLTRRPHVLLDVTIAGGLVWVPCDGHADAVEVRDMLCRFMVPGSAVTAVGLDSDGMVPLSALRRVGCLRATGRLRVVEAVGS